MHPVLRRAHGAAESGAGAVLPYAAHRVFRRHRQRAWDRMAGGGLAGAAQFSGSGTERDAARSLGDPSERLPRRRSACSTNKRSLHHQMGSGALFSTASFYRLELPSPIRNRVYHRTSCMIAASSASIGVSTIFYNGARP